MLNRFSVGVALSIGLLCLHASCRRADPSSASSGASGAAEGGKPASASGPQRPSNASAAPNVLIITIDTLRADHLGCYGYFRDTSPNIDALAAVAIVFERCLAPVAQTLPTHMSLFTGVYPLEHGFQANRTKGDQRWVPSPVLKTFATVLSDNGYTTAGFISAAPIKKITGMAAGFSFWSEPNDRTVTADDTTRRVIDWLEGEPSEPFMLWVHYFDTHAPYEPRPPYDTLYTTDDGLEAYLALRRFSDTAPKRYRKPRGEEGIRVKDTRTDNNLYDGELRFIDDHVGKLFDVLKRRGLWERLAILLTADHGEGLGQHGREGHGRVWREQLHVPLMMRIPGRAPKRVAVPLSSVDVLPTFLALARDVPTEAFLAQCVGVNVLDADGASRPIYGQMPAGHKQDKIILRSISLAGWRFILDAVDGDKLFYLDADPYELNNVAEQYPDKAAKYRTRLQQMVAAQTRRGRQNQAGRVEAIDRGHREALEALGYIDDDE